MVKNQVVNENYAIYNADCMEALPTMPDEFIDFSVYSPPFADLYVYSSDERDFSNCENIQQFLNQYEYLVEQIAKKTKPGRITAVHCQDLLTNVSKHDIYDLPHEIIRIHEKYGFKYKNRITIWKEPLKVRIRTMVRSLMHKSVVEDSTKCFTALPDYVLIFKKAGENKTPVTHENGLTEYYGDRPMLPEMEKSYGMTFEDLRKKYRTHKNAQTNKFAHVIWQRYASSVWDDIRNDNILPFRESKEEDDEKHVHPLQLDVIYRLVELYSNPGETVFTPFMGVGSEVYAPVRLGRKGIGVELKESYYKQAVINMNNCLSEIEAEVPKLF